MSALHPKLNWEEFERVRAERKRRKFWLWFGATFGLIALVGATSYWVYVEPAAEQTKTRSRVEKPLIQQQPTQQPEGALAEENLIFTQPNTPTKPTQKATATPAKVTTTVRETSLLTAVKDENEVATNITAVESEPVTAVPLPEVVQQSVEAKPTPAEPTSPAPSVVAAETVDSLPAVADQQLAPKKLRTPRKLDSWLALSWVPWHTAELRTDRSPAGGSLKYRPLNSVQLSWGVSVVKRERWRLSVEPQYALQRFQMQLKGDLESFQIAPGSVVGYIQDFKGIEPIISDTVRGKALVQAYANGAQHDLFLPVTLTAQLWSRNSLQVRFNVSAGMNYVLLQRGQWFNGAEIYSLNAAAGRFGLMGAGGLQLVYQPGRIAYQLAIQSVYRTTTTANQLPWRNQLGLSVMLPLTK